MKKQKKNREIMKENVCIFLCPYVVVVFKERLIFMIVVVLEICLIKISVAYFKEVIL